MVAGWPPRLKPMVFGGDYNPEQWPRDVQLEDIELMQLAGVSAVTVGVFAWSLLEPAEGKFECGWLDEVMDRLGKAGIAAVLGTPTASPPPWFAVAYAEALPITREGVRLGPGAREAFCPSSGRYRDAATRITARLAERYADHPALSMWHVGNEFGAHVGACYCDASVMAFRTWLQHRYGDLAALNEAWGTTFWGQRYHDWQEVGAPRPAPMPVNPTQQLDFMRFTSGEFLECFRGERDVLHRLTPDVPVTTNFMLPACRHIDYWEWADEVDLVGNDHYLDPEDPEGHVELALAADLSRSLAGGRPWLLLENSTSAVNWRSRNLAKLPGQLRRNSLTHVARGSDGAMFFQWRASRFGAEKFHSAMLPQAGTSSRVWQEITALGDDLRRLGPVAGSRVQADVAVMWDWQSWWALELEYRPSADLRYLDAVRQVYSVLWHAGRTVDFIRPGAATDHRLLIVPSLYLMSSRATEVLDDYVRGGGTLLVGPFSGIVDENDAVPAGPYPGGLRDLLGLFVEEFHPLREDERAQLSGTDDGQGCGAARIWSERVVPRGARPLWSFADGPDAACPALTRHDVGAGSAWYLATRPDDAALRRALDLVARAAGLPDPVSAPPGVEVVHRHAADVDYLFLINHVDQAVTVPVGGTDLLSGSSHETEVPVPAGGVAVVRRPMPAELSAPPGASLDSHVADDMPGQDHPRQEES